jgi:hypothetical protein
MVNADGRWALVIDSSMGKQEITVDLTVDGDKLTGIATAEGREINPEVLDGTITGDQLSWKLKVRKPVRLTLTLSTTVDGDTMTGKAKAGVFGSYPVTGHRI